MKRAGFVEGVWVTIAADRETMIAMHEWAMKRPYCFNVAATGGWTDGALHTWGGFLRVEAAERLKAWLAERGVTISNEEPLGILQRTRGAM